MDIKSKAKREIWLDNVKGFACVLVVLGHFFQSMTRAEVLIRSDLYLWFDKTIYFFHVPLFFICSGYLYQKYSRIDSIHSWKINIFNKAIALGVPYFVFSLITWLLKRVFASSVNSELGGLFETLFIIPVPPYWYLYILFLVFVITPTFKKKKVAIIAAVIALIMKLGSLILTEINIYAISKIMGNEIWFVGGMCLCFIDFNILFKRNKELEKRIGVSLCVVFILLSILVYVKDVEFVGMSFWMGILACTAVVMLFISAFSENRQSRGWAFLAKYMLPIFVMHTIFAAGLRSLLLKVGIENDVAHIILGLSISFIGPIIAAMAMERFKWLDFFLYPGKYIKIGNDLRKNA